jgi:hypothetical protein
MPGASPVTTAGLAPWIQVIGKTSHAREAIDGCDEIGANESPE